MSHRCQFTATDPDRRAMPLEICHLWASTDLSGPVNRAVTAGCELAQIVGARLSRLPVIEIQGYAVERA